MTDFLTEHRTRLFGIAYRMLGRVVEAEDMVQETWLRWQRRTETEVREPVAWLTTTITRLCIDQLRMARREREEYFGVWLPEPLVSGSTSSPAAEAGLAESLEMAFLLMLEELTPVDRAIFLLREAFGHDYAEIAKITARSEAACRQTVSRARARLGRREVKNIDSAKGEELAKEFLGACESGNMDSLLAMLTDDSVLYSDGGGVVRAVLKPIRSRQHVARFLTGIQRKMAKWHPDTREHASFVRVNGDPGILLRRRDGVLMVTAFSCDEAGRIKALYMVSNPQKLMGIDEELVRQLDEG